MQTDAQEISALGAAVFENAQGVLILHEQLRRLEKSLALGASEENSTDPGPRAHYAAVEARIQELEIALEELSENTQRSLDTYNRVDHERLLALTTPTPIASEYRPNPVGEAAYEKDAGKPLGAGSESVADAFHAVGGNVQLSDVECKRSVCRVAYSHVPDAGSESAAFEDSNSELVENLVARFNGANLNISYARSPNGEELMYIQLL